MPSLKVASHPAAVEQGTATVPVRLAFTTPPNFAVGTPVQVAIDAETHKGVVLVPAAAIVHQGGERAVFVLMGDPGQSSTAQRRDVMTGLETADQVEVVSGVKAGEMVLTSGQNGLPDGAKVTLAKPGSAAAGGNAAEDEKADEKKDADQP
jgi:hypothetical protein